MDIASIATRTLTVTDTASPGAPAAPPAGAFARVLGHYLGNVGQQQAQAQQAVQQLAMGQTDGLHNVVLQVARADLAFRLFLEIRNRLSDAYQEVMKMSV